MNQLKACTVSAVMAWAVAHVLWALIAGCGGETSTPIPDAAAADAVDEPCYPAMQACGEP